MWFTRIPRRNSKSTTGTMAANLRTFAWSRAIIGSFELLVLPKSPLFTHNDKNSLLSFRSSHAPGSTKSYKSTSGKESGGTHPGRPHITGGQPHPPNNSAPRCCKLHDERSFPCTRLDVGPVLRNPVLVSEEPLSHSERSAESLRLPRLIDGSKRSTEHASGGEGGTTPSECLGSSHVSKDAPLRTERAFKAY